MLRGGLSQPGVNDIQYSEERGERPALSRLCNAPPADTEHCFPLSPLCLLGTKINKPLSLAPSLSTSLMKCNLLSPNIVHHAPALLCKVSLSSLYLCFPFCVPHSAGTQAEIVRLQEDKALFPACFGTDRTHFLSIRQQSKLYLCMIFMWTTRGEEFPVFPLFQFLMKELAFSSWTVIFRQ